MPAAAPKSPKSSESSKSPSKGKRSVGRPRSTPEDRLQLAQERKKAQQMMAELSRPPAVRHDPNRFILSPEQQVEFVVNHPELFDSDEYQNTLPLYNRIAILEYLETELVKGRYLNDILREDGMPIPSTFDKWTSNGGEFATRLRRALESGYDRIAEECLHIADRTPGDAVDVQHQRLMVETRLKLLSKWFPKKYGDSLNLTGEVKHTISPLEQLRRMERKPAPTPTPVIDAEVVPPVSEEDCF